MAKKVTFNEFVYRFNVAHPGEDVSFDGYTAITNPVDITCSKCGRVAHYKNCNRAITGYSCCGKSDVSKCDAVKKWLDDNDEFEFVSFIDSQTVVVKHIKCGNTYKKDVGKFFSCPTACSHCDTRKASNTLSYEDAQANLDKIFGGQLELLEYNGRHERCRYRCTKCNQIFSQKFDCLLGSTGCPKCDAKTSLGERFLAKYLSDHEVNFKRQVSVDGLSRQHFDFGVYDDLGKLEYLIEVQGEQHYRPTDAYGDDVYAYQVELDNRKRAWCSEHCIPLYELVYIDKKFENLDILPV